MASIDPTLILVSPLFYRVMASLHVLGTLTCLGVLQYITINNY